MKNYKTKKKWKGSYITSICQERIKASRKRQGAVGSAKSRCPCVHCCQALTTCGMFLMSFGVT